MASAAELIALAGQPSSPSRAEQLAALAPFPGSAAHEAGAGALAPILSGLARGAWAALDYPRQVLQGEAQVMDPATGHVSDEAVNWGAERALGRLMPQRIPVAPGEFVLGAQAFHGSPRTDLTTLQPSTRGPLGPGVYLSPAEQVAQRYAGEAGKIYQTDIPDASLFHGIKSRDSSVNPYQVWRDQSARLVEAAPSEQRAAVAELTGRMDPSDGYPFFVRLSQLMGGQDKTQDLLKSAGFKGMTGHVDGPEIVHFDPLLLQAGSRGVAPIRAYHGSPHDFDRFDINRIGTGEGAQAYGHGLYFAENEGVARGYRKALAGDTYQQLDTWSIKGDTPEARLARQSLADYGRDPQATVAVLDSMGDPQSKAAADLIRSVRGQVREHTPGRMYEVGIHADPERFLDWDKPLYKQPNIVEMLEQQKGYPLGPWDTAPTGAGIAPMSRSQAERLREAGIPGIKYLDAGSRGAGTGSRNYVTFSDDIVEILRKYGLAGLGIGVPAALTMQPPPAQQQ